MRSSINLENKTLSDIYWRVQLVYMKVQAHSSLEPPLEYNQDQMPLMNQGENIESQTHSNIEFTIWTSEDKKDCYKASMVTYHTGDWIKAGVHLGKGSMGFGLLLFFETD